MAVGFDDVVILGEVVKASYEIADDAGAIDKFIAAFRRRNYVLLLGASGVGKSNLASTLKEEVPVAVDLLNRTVVVEKSSMRLSRQPFKLIDTPGEIGLKSQRMRAYREVEKRRSCVAINVVANGYHEFPLGLKLSPVTKRGAASSVYLKDRKDREIEALDEWTSELAPKSLDFVITVVSKQDLWAHDYVNVMASYESGPYGEMLLRKGFLNHVVVPYCAVFQQFYGQVRGSGALSEAQRLQGKANLLRILLNIANKV